jgi:hypothetical protein
MLVVLKSQTVNKNQKKKPQLYHLKLKSLQPRKKLQLRMRKRRLMRMEILFLRKSQSQSLLRKINLAEFRARETA